MPKTAPALPSPFKAVVFDCDGVLFDSSAANVRFYDAVLARFGRPPVAPHQREFCHMHPVWESLRYLMGDGAEAQKAWEWCRTLDFMEFNGDLEREPGLLEFLNALRPRYRTALATNRAISTRKVLAHFGLLECFDLIVTAEDVPRPKPHPDEMERVLAAFSLAPGETLYIGDSRVDEEFARATGVYFVAYKNPALTADRHVSHFDELRPLLRLP